MSDTVLQPKKTYTEADFNKTTKSFLIAYENNSTEIYCDHKGLATIGIGYCLSKNNWKKDFENSDINRTEAQIARIEKLLKDLPTKKTKKEKDALVEEYNQDENATTLTDTEIDKLFQIILKEKKEVVKDKLGKDIYEKLDNSDEMVALTSFAFQNKTLIGDNLISAIKNNDRIGAFYEIEYASNKERLFGVHTRRNAEAKYFGIFKDDNNITQEEAIKAIKFFASKKDDIDNYLKSLEHITNNETRIKLTDSEIKTEQNNLSAQLKPAKDLLAQQYQKGELKFDDKNLEKIILNHIKEEEEKNNQNLKGEKTMDNNATKPSQTEVQTQSNAVTANEEQTQNMLAGLVNSIPEEKKKQISDDPNLAENEKGAFRKIFDWGKEKVDTVKQAVENPKNFIASQFLDNVMKSDFIKALLALFGIKEERFKELFSNVFNGQNGLQESINNLFGRPPYNSPEYAQLADFSKYNFNTDFAGCRMWGQDKGITCSESAYNKFLTWYKKGEIDKEYFNYCVSRNPVRQDMNNFYNDMKAYLGEDVANIMTKMAMTESGGGTNILNPSASGAGGELQLLRSNVIATAKNMGIKASKTEILRAYDENPEFRNKVQAEFTRAQLSVLKPPTMEGIRAVWFLGTGGGPAFLRALRENPNMSVADITLPNGKRIFTDSVLSENNMTRNWTAAMAYKKFIADAGWANTQPLNLKSSSDSRMEITQADLQRQEESNSVKM